MKKYKNLKRFLSMVLSISMVVGLVAVVEPREAEAAAGTNLVANSGFDTTDSWDGAGAQEKVQDVEIVETTVFEAGFEPSEGTSKIQTGWNAGANASLDSTDVYGNESTQSLVWDVATAGAILEFQPFQVEEGRTYTISYDWKIENGTATAYHCYFRAASNMDALIGQSEVLWSAPNGWNHVRYEYTATASDTLYFYIEANAGVVHVDNVSISNITEIPKMMTTENTVFEAGFEPSEDKNQVQPWLAGEKATLDAVNVYGDKSTQSLKWNTSDSTILEFMPFQVEAGKTYTISYDWKVEGGASGPFYCRFNQCLNQSEVLWDAPVGWNHVEYEATATASDAVILYIEASSGTVYVDNVRIYYETEQSVLKLTDGIGNCDGTESDNVLMMKELTEVSQNISVSNGKRYKYSFQVKNTATESDFSFGLYAGDIAIDETITGATTANGWHEVSGIFDATVDATKISFKRSGVGTVYIDDVQFTEVQKVDMKLSEPAFNGETFSVSNNWSKEALDAIYGVRTAGMVSQGSVWVNNTEKKANYFLEADGTFVLWNLGTNVGAGIIGAATQIEIREGTVVTFEGHEAAPIVIQNTVTLKKSASGVWYNPNVTEHTQLGGNPLPEGMTTLIEGGDCSGAITNADLVTNTTIADGMVHINVSGTDDYLQIHSIPVNAGHTYKISYYIWINGSNSLKYNMYAAGDGANGTWEDWLMGTEASLTADTNAWQKVEFDWTAAGSGTVAFGFKNYDANGSAQIYLDDIVVYDTTQNLVETSADMTFSQVVNDTQLEFYAPNDAITTLIDGEEWPSSTASVVINGTETEVNIYMAPYDATNDSRYFWIHGDIVTEAIAAGKMTLTGPMVSTFGDEKITFNIAEGTIIEKVGSAWGAYTDFHEYPEHNNVFYYNIDNGTTYVLTSSNNAMEVRKDNAILGVAAGSELSGVGVYDIVRVENNEKFIQQVILYKNGDVNISGTVDSKDLVAIKKSISKQYVEGDITLDGVWPGNFVIKTTANYEDTYGVNEDGVCASGTATVYVDGVPKLCTLRFEKDGVIATEDITSESVINASLIEINAGTILNVMVSAKTDAPIDFKITNGLKLVRSGSNWVVSSEAPTIAAFADEYIADLDSNGVVSEKDAEVFRYLVVQEDDAAAFVEEKGNSVLNGVMPIAGFDGPTGTLVNDTVFGYMKELGINMLVHDTNDISDLTLGAVPMDNLKLAEKYSIGVYVTDGHIRANNNYLSTEKMVQRVGLYSAYQSFLGVHLVDEPGTYSYKSTNDRQLTDYVDGINLFKKYANLNGYVNLLPYDTADKTISEDVYNNYLTDVVNAEVDVLSYDNYPVGKGKTLGIFTTKKTNYEGFYRNLKLAREKSIDSGKPFWTFAQVGDGFTDANTKNIDETYLPTAAEMQWEINASLAFGSKGIQYYSVVQPEQYAKNTDGTYDYTRSGLISANGEKNTRYFDAAKSINNYIAVIDEVLMNSESKALIVNDTNASNYVTGVTGYKEVESVDGTNALVGCFDYFGKTALLVVNCDVSTVQKITVKFNQTQAVKVIEHDCSTDMSDSQVESLALTIGAGQSALVVIED